MSDSKSTNREVTTRDKEVRVAQMYTPPSVLPFPDPEPGVVFRYVATHVLGQADPANVSKRYREGWQPVKASDYPELMLNANSAGNVEIGGLMLCKMSAEQAQAREEYYQAQTAAQMESVDNHFLKNNDPRMPLFRDRASSTTRGRGFGSGNK
jgi:hypothetical protein